MKTIIIVAIGLFLSQVTAAQNKFEALIKDQLTSQPLIGSSGVVKGTTNGNSSDINGKILIENIPGGNHAIIFSFIGYQTQELVFNFPLADSLRGQTIYLKSEEHDLGEVTITSTTRSSRNIANIPTRIETIAAGELEEKSVMQPGNIKMLLTESTGIQTQQTSQVSGSASIRIQGLDGKYTQLLQDGFPLYSGFSSGLSILQIPPLNLKRVEVIKGSTSTLYGGGAIAGLINLISKEPQEKTEASVLVNANQTSALDISTFYAEQYKKTGMTIYAATNFQKAYNNNGDDFSDIPRFARYTINPKFFYYPNQKTTLSVGLNAGIEKRMGGDLSVINGHSDSKHVFFEKNNSNRYSSQSKFERIFSNNTILTVKNSVGYFSRNISRADYNFDGQQVATFSEANYLVPGDKSEWNMGLNYVTDQFKQLHSTSNKLDYSNTALGAFAQNSLNLTSKFIVESGLRIDMTNHRNIFVLPRLSLLYKINPKLTTRISSGLGYKMPTVFSEEAEEKAFKNILPIDFSQIKPEKSYGLNGDINYKATLLENIFFSINQMFFYTTIEKPLILNQLPATDQLIFENATGNFQSKGFETNVKLRYMGFSTYLGYTFIDASRKVNNTRTINPLTAKHRINANLMYEWDEKLRIAYEAFFVGKQRLNSGEKTRDYWVMGLSGEYKFKHFSLFLNFENFLDSRQSRWGPMYSGTIQNPIFHEVYTPTDGFIFNGGFKLNF